jgi:hypothetical protein
MMRFEILLIILVLLDCTTTYLLSFKYPVEYEFNFIVRELMRAWRELVFLYAVVEYFSFMLLYEVVQFLKAKFNIKYRIEYSIVLLLIFAVTSNMIGLLI